MATNPLTWQAFAQRGRKEATLIMAHRGASDELPENTFAAFTRALEQGAEVLETDIRFTRDDAIVVMHDATLERTTDRGDTVAEITLAEFKRARTRRPNDTVFSSESPPALDELLEFTGAGTPLALELKDDRFKNARDAQAFVALLEKHNAVERCACVSFDLERLLSVKRVEPRLPIGHITISRPFPTTPTEFLGPFYLLLYFNPLYVWWARRLGKIVCPLDPAPEPRIGYYIWLGVTILLTNHPAVTRRLVEQAHN
jgi:glycerophosphoryl diester phosphodiesterase